MTFIDQWHNQLNHSLIQFAQLATAAPDINLNHGLLATAILWPIRQPVQKFDGEAMDAVRAIVGVEAKHIFKAVQSWGDDPLASARSLADQAQENTALSVTLGKLSQHFNVTSLFAEELARAVVKRQDKGDVYNIAGQIKAALVNIGGTTTIQSLTLQIVQAAPTQPQFRIQIPPPPQPIKPPEFSEFVGRKAELAYYADKLATSHQCIITGMVGVGKTALAAVLVDIWKLRQMRLFTKADPLQLDLAALETMLAQRNGDYSKVFWHTFHEGEGVNVIIWKMAGFLAWHGQQELWEMLQSIHQTGGQLPPPASLFDYLFQMIRGREYLLCLDAFHFIEDDPLLEVLMKRLSQAVQAGEVSLIITSRRIPKFVLAAEFMPLVGLNAADIQRLLITRGLSLSDELITELYTHTEGNPQLLLLVIDLLKRAKKPAQVMSRLVEVDDLERYLIKEVDEGLSEADREIMIGVAILLGYSGTRYAIETVVNRSRLKRLLLDLCDRYLLVVHENEEGESYSQHTLMQAFYYDIPGQRERSEMHHRAGLYYELEEPDLFRAALHFECGGDYARAAKLATADIWALINQGQARALGRLLERLRTRQLSPEQLAMVNIARGETYACLGENKLARHSYQEAITQVATLPDTLLVRELNARVCLGLGDLLQYEAPPEALKWLQQGLDKMMGTGTLQEAALQIKAGTVQIAMANYAAALKAVEAGLSILPEGPSQLRISALINLAIISSFQGNIEQAIAIVLQGLEISQQLHDYFRMIAIWNNLGVYKMTAGDWMGAAEAYQQGLALAERLGSITRQVPFALNLGILYTQQGDHEAARQHLLKSLELTRQGNLRHYEPACLVHLADLHLRRQEPEAADPLLAEAEQLAVETDTKYQLPEIYRLWAQVRLEDEQLQAALAYAEQSVHLAQSMAMNLEEGISQRVLGQVLLANHQPDLAVIAFERSLSLLTGQDPYETARTQMVWACGLVSIQEVDQAISLLQEARAIFEALGAKHDLAIIDDVLGAVS